MAVYAIGDIQGCASSLSALLEKIRFDPSRDTIWLAGDLVNRGPDSLGTLRLVKELGNSAVCVLGNHDLHLLSVAAGVRDLRSGDTLQPILDAPDRDELLLWLRHQPLVHVDEKLQALMTHAGLYPGWNVKQLKRRAQEVETVLRSADHIDFFRHMYGKRPACWSKDLVGWDRLRFITNTLTRMRYCDTQKRLDFGEKGAPDSARRGLFPWFRHPAAKGKKWRIVFGHWSSLGFFSEANVIGLDSGCVWGGSLTAVKLSGKQAGQYWQHSCQ